MLTFTDVNVLKGKGASGRKAECCQASGPWSGAQETCIPTPLCSYVTPGGPLNPSAAVPVAVNNVIPELLSRSRILRL